MSKPEDCAQQLIGPLAPAGELGQLVFELEGTALEMSRHAEHFSQVSLHLEQIVQMAKTHEAHVNYTAAEPPKEQSPGQAPIEQDDGED